MDRWPQRESFVSRMDEWMERENKTRKDVATALGRSKAAVDSWATRPETMPPLEVLRAAATLFGCSVMEFIDDPGAPPPGAPPEATEFDRFMLRAMGSDLEALTDEQKVAAFEAWKATMKAFKARKG